MQCPECGYLPPEGKQPDPTRCPECGIYYVKALEMQLAALKKQQGSAATTAPPVAPREPTISESMPKAQTLSIIGGVFLALLVIGIYFGNPGANAQKVGATCGSEGMAHTMAGNFVKRRLLAPSSAKFPPAHGPDVKITPLGGCRFRIESYVDSQNSFGAMIRSRFSVIIVGLPDGETWQAHELVID